MAVDISSAAGQLSPGSGVHGACRLGHVGEKGRTLGKEGEWGTGMEASRTGGVCRGRVSFGECILRVICRFLRTRPPSETPGSLMLLGGGALFLQVGDPHVDTGGEVFRSNNVMSSIVVSCHLLPVLLLFPLQDVDVRGLGQEAVLGCRGHEF